SIVAGERGGACSRDGRDLSIDVDPPHTFIQGVRDVEVAFVVEGQAPGGVQNCVQGRPAVAAIPGFTGSGNGPDDSVRADLADHVVPCVGDQERVAESDGEAGGEIELCLDAWFPV